MTDNEQRQLARLVHAARLERAEKPDENKGPVIRCHRCWSGLVQWDWRKADEDHLCSDCRDEEEVV